MPNENITTEVEAKYWAPSMDISDYPKSKEIEQGYFDLNNLDESVKEFFLSKFPDIDLSEYVEARLRNKGGKYFLTLKGDGTLERSEAEESITEDEFTKFWPLTSAGNVQKTRHEKTLVEGELEDGGLTLETDVYREKLAGLFSAEIEYNPSIYSKEVIDTVVQTQIPGAIDVTDVKALKNKRLAAYKNMDELREALLKDKEAVAIFSRVNINNMLDIDNIRWKRKRMPSIKVDEAYNGIVIDMDNILGQIDPNFTGWVDMDHQITKVGMEAIQNNPSITFEELKDVLRGALLKIGKVEYVIQKALESVNYAKQENGEYHSRVIIITRGSKLRHAARKILIEQPDMNAEELTTKLNEVAAKKGLLN